MMAFDTSIVPRLRQQGHYNKTLLPLFVALFSSFGGYFMDKHQLEAKKSYAYDCAPLYTNMLDYNHPFGLCVYGKTL